MSKNIFEEYQDAKQRLIEMARKAKAYGWIDAQRERDIVDKINNAVLTLGVIGQMKCGKSTFLNAFVFGDNVLPAATTPMTAALSVITYGEKEKIEIDFYTADEWAEQELLAERELDKAPEVEKPGIKVAKELLSKAQPLGAQIKSLLGTKREDSMENLKEYVGADGRYVAITKSVTIYRPEEYLRGVEIVDTPGLNDPVASREERTRTFLNKADVVLLMLYAKRPFDATDSEILFENVRQCGIGNVLICANKYDEIYGEKGDSEVIDYIKNEINNKCDVIGDETMNEILKNSEPILVSALMALCAEMSLDAVKNDEEFHFHWNNLCKKFGISTQKEFYKISHISQLIDAIRRLLEHDKLAILIRARENELRQAGQRKIETAEKKLYLAKQQIENLDMSDDQLDSRLKSVAEASARIERKIERIESSLIDNIERLKRKGRNEIEDQLNSVCNRLRLRVDELGRTQSPERIFPSLESECNIFVQQTIRRILESLCDDVKECVKDNLDNFTEKACDILHKYVPDFDSDEFREIIAGHVNMQVEDYEFSAGKFKQYLNEKPWYKKVGGFITKYSGIRLIIGNGKVKTELNEAINNFKDSINADEFVSFVLDKGTEVINEVRRAVIDEVLAPMQQQLKVIRSNVKDREEAKAKAIAHKGELESELATRKQQYAEMFGGE